jgi:hypothetical protein
VSTVSHTRNYKFIQHNVIRTTNIRGNRMSITLNGIGFVENSTTLDTSYTLADNRNAMTAGAITVSDGVTITVGDGSTWTVV